LILLNYTRNSIRFVFVKRRQEQLYKRHILQGDKLMLRKSEDNICQVKLDDAISALIAVLYSRDGLLRERARRSLVAIGSIAVEPLIDTLEKGNETARWEAAKAISEIGDPNAAYALVGALEDNYFDVRWVAAEGLITLGIDSLRPLLEVLLKSPDSTWLREGAHHVLRGLCDLDLEELVDPTLTALEHVQPAHDLILSIRQTLDKL
jgi:HEAT repeat protein